ncbi:hypothetical protein FACS1894190_09890 [Spirochaetia bacterium]|nr:hypothetical protein FACS1894190_09890 [Spirochaetia bacterium]
MDNIVEQLILDQLKDIRSDINILSEKLDESTKDRAELNAQITSLSIRVSNVEQFMADMSRKANETLWSKVPEKIINWAVPFILAAVMWAFMNGYQK